MIDTLYGSSVYPEVLVVLDQEVNPMGAPFPMDEWHLVTMSWDGYPEGRMSIFIDGRLVEEREYDSRFDRGDPLPQEMAVGMRPQEWPGEMVKKEDGSFVDSRPDTALSVADSNIDICDMRLYQCALNRKEIQKIMAERAFA